MQSSYSLALLLAGLLASARSDASAAALYESAGLLPEFTHHGADLEQPGVFEAVVKQIAFRNEVILVCGDAKPTASSANGLNTLLHFRSLRLHHVLYLSDSAASCAALKLALPEVACVWSSRIPASKPKNGGLCVQLYWGYAFYFYDLRKHYAARMTIELSINVLQTDTDVVWLANPYPALKQVFGGQQIIGMSDRPMINAGVFYAQNVKAGDGASWVLRELSRRIHTFILRPSAVRDYVKWAQPPFYANVDEQTLMNDCVRSSIANVSSFAQATAGWEVKKHRTGTVMNKSFSWKATAEYRLTQWLNRVVPAAGKRYQLPSAVPVHQLCGAPTIKSPGIAYPLHAVGTADPPRRAALTIGPSWLFMHLPSSMAAGSIRKCRTAANASAHAVADAGGSAPAAVPPHRQRAPFIMAHLAGVRTGAWSRRALVRAYGWWNARADEMIAKALGWNQRLSGTLLLLASATAGSSGKSAEEHRAMMGQVVTTQARFDVLVANLLLIGALSGRRVIVPEVPCTLTTSGSAAHRGYGNRPVGARASLGGEASCAWMPPKECWAAEYTTQLEFEREQQAARDAGGVAPKAASASNRRAARLLGGGKGAGKAAKLSASGAAATECEEAGRLMVHAVSLAAGRAAIRNVTLLALRRRLRELPCDPRPLLAVLSGASAAAAATPSPIFNASGAGNASAARALRRRSQAVLLELLARAPLMRNPSRQLHLLDGVGGASGLPEGHKLHGAVANTTLMSVRRETPCIEALYKYAASASPLHADAAGTKKSG